MAPKNTLKWFSFIGMILFVLILKNIDIDSFIHILKNIQLDIFILSLALQIINIFIKSEKWRILALTQKIEYDPKRCAKVWIIGYGLGILTPGRIGDLTRSVYLKKDTGISYGSSVATVVLDRIMDLAALILFSLLGLIVFNPMLEDNPIKKTITIAILIISLISAASLKKNLIKKFLRPIFNRFVKENKKQGIRENFDEFYKSMNSICKNRRTMLLASMLTILSWIIILLASYLITVSIGIEADPVYILLIMPLLSIVELIPISISGIGTRDVASITLFSLAGISKEQSFTFSTLLLVTSLILAATGIILIQNENIRSRTKKDRRETI